MANTLRFKRGLVSGIPTAALGEPLFTTDTFDLYIGNGTTNTRFQKYIASGTTSQLLRGDGSLLTMPIVLTSPSNGQVLKYDGTNWVNSADAGVTGSGTTNYLSKWTSSSALGNSLVFDNGTNVLINTTTALWSAASRQTFEINGNAQSLLALNVSNTSAGYLWHSGTYLSLANIRNSFISFVTNSAEYMRLHATGNLSLNSTTDNGLRFQVTGDGFFSGSVGIGTSTLTGRSLSVSKNITGQYIFSGGSYGVGVLVDGVIQSDEVGGAAYFRSFAQTQASSFTAGAVYHFEAVQGTFGAGSTVSNQVGFFARETLIGATNNFGFYGNIASGTNRWNLYMNGSAANYANGNTLIGEPRLAGAAWTKYLVVGDPSLDKVILGYLASSTNGATIGANNGNLNAWANLNIAGSQLLFRIAETERMRLDASGNLGLGVVPSAWSSLWKAIQVQNAAFASLSSSYAFVGQNWYNDGASKFLANGRASLYQQYDGVHSWYYTTSNSSGAGAAITFTQAMTLDASGNLGVGLTAPRVRVHALLNGNASNGFTGSTIIGQNSSSGNSSYLTLVGAFDADAGIVFTDESVGYRGRIVYSNNNEFMSFWTDLSERMRIHATGNLSLNSTTDAGFRLDVNGTMRVSGASTFNGNMTNAFASLAGGTTVIGGITGVSNGFRIDVDTSNSYQYSFRSGTNTTLFQIANTGAATFSSSVTAGSFIPTSSTVPTNGMYLPTTNTVAFSTNSTEDMRLTSSGNLLINTTTDSGERLQVNGTAKIGTHSTTGFSLVVQNNGANDTSGIRISTGATVDGYISMAYDATNTYGSIQAGDNNVFRNIVINRQGGSVGIGANPNNSAVLQADSTTRGFLPPRMTTTQRNAIPTPSAGLIVYDTTDNKHYGYNGTIWNAFY